MAILRSRTIEQGPRPLAVPGLERARREAEARLVEAVSTGQAEGRRQAEADLVQREQALAAGQAAFDRTLAEARARLEQEFHQRFDQALAALTAATKTFEETAAALRQAAAPEVVRLALAIAARLLRREIRADPHWLDEVLRSALAQLPGGRPAVLRLHPADAATIHEQLGAWSAQTGSRIELIEDPAIGRGGVRLESDGTQIEAGPAEAWQRLAHLLHGPEPVLVGGGGEP